MAGESPSDWPTDKPSRLAADHDLMLVLPATANILSAAATGAAPNRYDVVSGNAASHPAIPRPPDVVKAIQELLAGH